MKTTTVVLTGTEGVCAGQEYVFEGCSWCLIGRADDCDVQLPRTYGEVDISRHHCVIEIDPPVVRIRDLGSRNGTFVNDLKIGQRADHKEAEEANPLPPHELRDGDRVRVGDNVFQVAISAVPEFAQVPIYIL